MADQKIVVGRNGEFVLLVCRLTDRSFLCQIPEKYFALVTKYLADVKGGIRDVCLGHLF